MIPLSFILRSRCRAALSGCAYNYLRVNIMPAARVKNFCRSSSVHNRTIGHLLDHWSRNFENDGISEPVESIEHIVAHVMGTKKILDLVNMRERELTKEEVEKLEMLCQCRLSRMPVQYIIGEWDFRDITLNLIPPVFIPRPETEILVDIVLKQLSSTQQEKCRILEIGCGSGAISLALAHSSDKVQSVAIDVNKHACNLTRSNCKNLGLDDRLTIINAALEKDGIIKILDDTENKIEFNREEFDFIVSNPPYVPTSKLSELAPEIKIYEDLRALDGGSDGLDVIKPLLRYAAKALKTDGSLFIEVDTSHPEYIVFFTKKYSDLKLKHLHTYKDFCNNDRFVQVLKFRDV
ncbi:hemK methyltransferase family member 1 [Cephus cinctus]|uniref:peptide chain release factor N(5)-glutamine methyltransferase n=1 Tax=Cephus cinctus TaxID=211228 RepID=A0AAJ7C767_CEPCN|nr:hemK methyltransferase family member 1 [Cephus cinctus]